MSVIGWIVFGLIAGGVARWLMPTPGTGGCLMTMLLGVVGSCVGGWIGTQLGWGDVNGFDLRSMGLAVLGALSLLAAARVVGGRVTA